MIKWADRSGQRGRLVNWIDRSLKTDPFFTMDSFICGWTAIVDFEDIRTAVRQCSQDDLDHLSWARDEFNFAKKTDWN